MNQAVIRHRETYRSLTMEKRWEVRGWGWAWTRGSMVITRGHFSSNRRCTRVTHGAAQCTIRRKSRHIHTRITGLPRQVVHLFTAGMTRIFTSINEFVRARARKLRDSKWCPEQGFFIISCCPSGRPNQASPRGLLLGTVFLPVEL